MRWALDCLLVLFAFAVTNSYCTCPPPIGPIHIDVRNITLPSQYRRRGLAIQIGSPPQSLVLLPSSRWNYTYVFDANSPCDEEVTLAQCNAQHGGFFDPGSSQTWKGARNADELSLPIGSNSAMFRNIWGTDQLTFTSDHVLSDYPVSIQRVDVQDYNLVGLGSNSSLVSALFKAGAIASRTWSLAWGRDGVEAEHQVEGGFVLGGYDAAKSKGSSVTYPLTAAEECPSGLLVTIDDIAMNLKNGSNLSMLGANHGSALRACLRPEYSLITLPQDVFQNFISLGAGTFVGRSTGLVPMGMDFEARDVYDGDLTFVMSNGLSIRIPNYQLVKPDFSVDSRGQNEIINSSIREVMLNKLEGVTENHLPLLGQTFLSSAYLTVDLDEKEFSLSEYNETIEQELVALGPRGCSSDVPAVPTAKPSNNSIVNTIGRGSTAQNQHAGTIAGVIVGCIAFVLIALGAFLWYRKSRARRAMGPERGQGLHNGSRDSPLSNPFFYNPELPTDRHPPQEMPLEKHQPSALAPYELTVGTHNSLELPVPMTPHLGHTEKR